MSALAHFWGQSRWLEQRLVVLLLLVAGCATEPRVYAGLAQGGVTWSCAAAKEWNVCVWV